MERLNSGDEKIIFGTNLSTLNIGLMKSGRVKWQERGGIKKRLQYCTDPSGQETLYLRALQGHSERNPMDPYHRTMYEFRTISSSTFSTSDVQSIYIPSQVQD